MTVSPESAAGVAEVYLLPVHPWADRFPMRSDDDLASMAESVKANGLREPITLGMAVPAGSHKPTLCIIDGRNRREACRIAGIVNPQTTTLNGEDQDALIEDKNLERRDLNKGQRAMLLAVRYPHGPRGRGAVDPARRKGGVSPSFSRVQQARLVNELCPEMVEAIIAGKLGLDDALSEAQRRRSAAQTEEVRFEKLELAAADLAEQVREERLKLSEAEAALRAREEDLRRQTETAQKIVGDINKAVSLLEGVYVQRIADFAAAQPELFEGLATRIDAWTERLAALKAAVEPQEVDHE